MSAFERYAKILAHDYVSYETLATCGRLVATDARFNDLITVSRALGHTAGPVTRTTWASFATQGRTVLAKIDKAWSLYLEELNTESPMEADLRLRATLTEVTLLFEELIGQFPQDVRIIDW